eukprot:3719584-Prymnesium_polylepis.1
MQAQVELLTAPPLPLLCNTLNSEGPRRAQLSPRYSPHSPLITHHQFTDTCSAPHAARFLTPPQAATGRSMISDGSGADSAACISPWAHAYPCAANRCPLPAR